MAGDHEDDAHVEEGGVVDPDDLDIEDDEHVQPLGDNRYVVSADDPIAGEEIPDSATGDPGAGGKSDPGDDPGPENDAAPDASGDPGQFEGDSVDVHRARARLTERMAETRGAYGFDVTAQFGDEVVQQHLQANDIVTVFDALLLWYAEHLDDETPAEEAIGILLAESDIPIEYPADALIALVRAHGLDGDDTIADLVDAACGETVQFPPR